ncbi:hypothetical protein [aff. Roholtiella sp. LEGE 12411]|uniref:hypothetical protein n=1 Tax=aff. Roholtiella sp. LEGE 12411 TaxID=1828822 RepID=UPI00187F559A|nr:hypothetical protein [aff. Roholtiella sp. LEGE 12411]MBE9038484.1 hypothetical protein [aff. Roholtiella sp. LEGE 12411]
MDKVLIQALAKEAKVKSGQAIEKFKQGKYIEGHSLMSQARDAGRVCSQLIKTSELVPVLTQFEKLSQE